MLFSSEAKDWFLRRFVIFRARPPPLLCRASGKRRLLWLTPLREPARATSCGAGALVARLQAVCSG
jgi:hypothetical protein